MLLCRNVQTPRLTLQLCFPPVYLDAIATQCGGTDDCSSGREQASVCSQRGGGWYVQDIKHAPRSSHDVIVRECFHCTLAQNEPGNTPCVSHDLQRLCKRSRSQARKVQESLRPVSDLQNDVGAAAGSPSVVLNQRSWWGQRNVGLSTTFSFIIVNS